MMKERVSFTKGMIFAMEGNEYEVLNECNDDPSSYLVFVSRHEKETADPLTLSLSKAEAKLARGDIMIIGSPDQGTQMTSKDSFYPPVSDPLEQIAELKKRIQAIEKRRISLLKIDDPKSLIMLQDNVVRPNKYFNIWDYTQSSGDYAKKGRKIQYIKIRGIMLVITSNSSLVEHFLFNISDQLQPCCRITGDTLSSEGKIKIDFSSKVQTILGNRTQILTSGLEGRIELAVELKLDCKFLSGQTIINANILQAAYIREVNAPGLKINKIAFPEIGDHLIAIEGICVDIYTEGPADM